MTPHRRTPDVLRHRHKFVCLWPRRDDSGLWLRVTWLFYTWDYFPPKIGKRFVDQADHFRKGGK